MSDRIKGTVSPLGFLSLHLIPSFLISYEAATLIATEILVMAQRKTIIIMTMLLQQETFLLSLFLLVVHEASPLILVHQTSSSCVISRGVLMSRVINNTVIEGKTSRVIVHISPK